MDVWVIWLDCSLSLIQGGGGGAGGGVASSNKGESANEGNSFRLETGRGRPQLGSDWHIISWSSSEDARWEQHIQPAPAQAWTGLLLLKEELAAITCSVPVHFGYSNKSSYNPELTLLTKFATLFFHKEDTNSIVARGDKIRHTAEAALHISFSVF